MSHAAAPLELTEAQRATLGAIAKSTAAALREVLRARVLLMAADGVANARIAGEVGVSVPTVREWRSRFAAEGLAKFAEVRKGRGRKVSIAQEKIDEIVRLTQYSKPPGQTHWSCRTMAKAAGVSPATVQRVWHARGLKPHLVDTFKLSNDKRFEEKLVDVVGLYMAPPVRHEAPTTEWDERAHSRPVAAGRQSREQPDPGDAGEGGKQLRQRRDGSELPDGPGPANKAGRCTCAGTSGRTPSSHEPAPTWWIWAGQQCTPRCWSAGATPKPVRWAGGEATRKACGVLVARLQGNSWAPHRSIGQ